jgi:transmembrane sensor
VSKSREIDRLLAEESAEWTERLKHGDRHTRAAFAKWSLKSPLHLRHFLMMVALDQELERFDPEKRITVPPASAHPSAEVIDLGGHASEAKAPGKRALRWWGLAASVLIAVSAVIYAPDVINRAQGWHEYSTARGEQRAVELPDGSVAHLNTSSRVLVRLSGEQRQVRLLAGEALFKVHHDASRPFRVYTDDATIQAVGTQFNVYREAEGTKVAVLEGRVRVTADESAGASDATHPVAPLNAPASSEVKTVKLLAAGEAAEVHQDGTISNTESVDVGAIAAWRQRRLVFKQDPLSAVVTEFNRYNRIPQFRLVGADVASRRYSGAFDADDPESLIALLSIDRDLQVQRDGKEIVIRARTPAGAFAQSP